MKMSNRNKTSSELIMREDSSGNLEFIGDFEELYKTEIDPWGQLGNESDKASYYACSREHLLKTLEELTSVSVLEVGCGLGVVTEKIFRLPLVKRAVGLDISQTAIRKASIQYPDCEFIQGDIRDFSRPSNWQDVDVVVMNQAYWYILDHFYQALDNMRLLLRDGGHLISVQAFFRDDQQRYGKEIINGFGGLVDIFSQQGVSGFDLVSANLTRIKDSQFDDGQILLLKK
ncbi:MAG: class I SAM-dependent methyltransferase [Pseudomonadota bacterium]|nr:class I SAM-dependent methyltransferase [Pseudomonadota bacterium]|tara:strand:- start:86 stop:775 length:690 start_codon:yes stop_codon:yes gene_type:complete